MQYTMRTNKDSDKVSFNGIDCGKMTIVQWNERIGVVVIKEAGSSYWGGIGCARSYSPASFRVMQINVPSEYKRGPDYVQCNEITSFPVRAAK